MSRIPRVQHDSPLILLNASVCCASRANIGLLAGEALVRDDEDMLAVVAIFLRLGLYVGCTLNCAGAMGRCTVRLQHFPQILL